MKPHQTTLAHARQSLRTPKSLSESIVDRTCVGHGRLRVGQLLTEHSTMYRRDKAVTEHEA